LRTGGIRRELALERNIVVLGTTTMLATFGNYLWFFFLPNYYASNFGTSPLVISIIYGAWFLAVGLGAAPAGALADIFGRKIIIVISGLVSSAGIFMLAFFSNNFLLSAIAFPLSGLGTSFVQVSYVLVAETVEKERRGVAFGTYQTFTYVASAFSPIIGGLATVANPSSLFLLFILGGGMTLLATAARAIFLKETFHPDDGGAIQRRSFSFTHSFKMMFSSKVLLSLLIVYSMYNLLVDQSSFVLPLYTNQVLGLGQIERGVFFGILLAVVAATRLPFGKLSDKIGRRKTIVISWIGESLVVYLIVFAPAGNLAFALFGVAVWSLFGVMDSPAANAWLADVTEAKSRGLSMGTFYSATSVIALPGAIFSGFLFSIQPQYPFYANSILGIFALVFLILLTQPYGNDIKR
jgi:MFS family permease